MFDVFNTFYFQIRGIRKNQTVIESWVIEWVTQICILIKLQLCLTYITAGTSGRYEI